MRPASILLVLAQLVALALFGGCATQTESGYGPKSLDHRELYWHSKSSQLKVMQDGRELGGVMDASGVADAVACVPAAKEQLDQAVALTKEFYIYLIAGAVAPLAGMGVFMVGATVAAVGATLALDAGGPLAAAALMAAGYGGAGIIGAAAVFAGFGMLFYAIDRGNKHKMHFVDGVNIYNDEYMNAAGCSESGGAE